VVIGALWAGVALRLALLLFGLIGIPVALNVGARQRSELEGIGCQPVRPETPSVTARSSSNARLSTAGSPIDRARRTAELDSVLASSALPTAAPTRARMPSARIWYFMRCVALALVSASSAVRRASSQFSRATAISAVATAKRSRHSQP
jgi:hypothetical protein